jgi:hypothetical protein
VFYRPALSGVLTFMERVQADTLDPRELASWFEVNLVRPGYMPAPGTVQEPGVGVVSLRDLPSTSWAPAYEERLRAILRAARLRVSMSLQGLLATPFDDRFLAAAIYSGRVARGTHWQPKLKGTERLSDILLAVLSADILAHRDEYDASLCVCAICGHVSLSRSATSRTRCASHASARPEGQRG